MFNYAGRNYSSVLWKIKVENWKFNDDLWQAIRKWEEIAIFPFYHFFRDDRKTILGTINCFVVHKYVCQFFINFHFQDENLWTTMFHIFPLLLLILTTHSDFHGAADNDLLGELVHGSTSICLKSVVIVKIMDEKLPRWQKVIFAIPLQRWIYVKSRLLNPGYDSN